MTEYAQIYLCYTLQNSSQDTQENKNFTNTFTNTKS